MSVDSSRTALLGLGARRMATTVRETACGRVQVHRRFLSPKLNPCLVPMRGYRPRFAPRSTSRWLKPSRRCRQLMRCLVQCVLNPNGTAIFTAPCQPKPLSRPAQGKHPVRGPAVAEASLLRSHKPAPPQDRLLQRPSCRQLSSPSLGSGHEINEPGVRDCQSHGSGWSRRVPRRARGGPRGGPGLLVDVDVFGGGADRHGAPRPGSLSGAA